MVIKYLCIYDEIRMINFETACYPAGRPRGRGSSPSRVNNFLHVVNTGSGAHPASYTMDTGGCFPGGKAA
jgi:hypothetical protein